MSCSDCSAIQHAPSESLHYHSSRGRQWGWYKWGWSFRERICEISWFSRFHVNEGHLCKEKWPENEGLRESGMRSPLLPTPLVPTPLTPSGDLYDHLPMSFMANWLPVMPVRSPRDSLCMPRLTFQFSILLTSILCRLVNNGFFFRLFWGWFPDVLILQWI